VDIQGELKRCLQDGEDLNKCLRGLADSFKPYMKTGFPELGIPKAEPLFIDQIKFDLKNPLIDVNVDFTENNVAGERDCRALLTSIFFCPQVCPLTNSSISRLTKQRKPSP